jgi:hypothetical protein
MIKIRPTVQAPTRTYTERSIAETMSSMSQSTSVTTGIPLDTNVTSYGPKFALRTHGLQVPVAVTPEGTEMVTWPETAGRAACDVIICIRSV